MQSLSRTEVEDFLFNEAELLDQWRLPEWLTLFTDDAKYEVPCTDLPADASSESNRERWKGTYVHGSLYSIPFENNYFDLVFFLDTIEHLTHPIDALREFVRVMKPGAKILICTMNYASPLWFVLEHTWHRFAGGTCKPYSKDVHPTPYTEKLLLEHCAGLFEEIKIEKRIMRMELFLTGRKATG